MKKINYILIAIFTTLLVLNPLKVNAKQIEITREEIPLSKQEIKNKIEIIDKYINDNNFNSYFENYFTIFIKSESGNHQIIKCGNESNEISFTTADLYGCKGIKYKINEDYLEFNGRIYINPFKVDNIIETNMKAYSNSDIVDYDTKEIIYKAGENFFEKTYLGSTEEPKVELPAITQQPVNCWFPFFLNKTSFDNFIKNNYNLDPNTENMVILYISINIIFLLIFLKIIKKYLYHVAKRFGVV